ncbi:MAG: glutathione S-transferase family protein [Gammaproteobacteria bacterium]|jgi:glutathione S-transferase
MIRLHGAPISNYYNTVKLALVEKHVEFEEVNVFPGRDPELLAASPMGKVPWIDIDGAPLTETNVIFDYLEDTQPQPALYPADPYARAKTKELIRVVELYLDAPARRHIAAVYFGKPVDDVVFKQVRPQLEFGLEALTRLAKFSPYIAGDAFTFADIAAYFQLGFANLHTQQIYDWDITAAVPGLGDYLAMLRERASVAAVDNVMQAAMAKMRGK